MKQIEITSCGNCPFCNNDCDHGRDNCNLSLHLGKKILLYWEQLPLDERHKDCPLNELEAVIKKAQV